VSSIVSVRLRNGPSIDEESPATNTATDVTADEADESPEAEPSPA